MSLSRLCLSLSLCLCLSVCLSPTFGRIRPTVHREGRVSRAPCVHEVISARAASDVGLDVVAGFQPSAAVATEGGDVAVTLDAGVVATVVVVGAVLP